MAVWIALGAVALSLFATFMAVFAASKAEKAKAANDAVAAAEVADEPHAR